jgi:hypothetical protein
MNNSMNSTNAENLAFNNYLLNTYYVLGAEQASMTRREDGVSPLYWRNPICELVITPSISYHTEK